MSVSDQRSQREVVEAAVVEAVAEVLHDHGPMNGRATERWQDCPNGEIHGGVADKVASTTVVQALLDVVEEVRRNHEGHRRAMEYVDRLNDCRMCGLLARLPEGVR